MYFDSYSYLYLILAIISLILIYSFLFSGKPYLPQEDAALMLSQDELEGFSGSSKNYNPRKDDVITNVEEIYDRFYAKRYDSLFLNPTRISYEAAMIKHYTIAGGTQAKGNVNILDLGCGTGHHLRILDDYSISGIDISKDMINECSKYISKDNLVHSDFHNRNKFAKGSFTHVICMFYTFYYSKNPEKLIKNVNYWLDKKGWFVVHLVDPNKFDPILEKQSALIPNWDPQQGRKKRKTDTTLKFKGMTYKSNWKLSNSPATFHESFQPENKNERKQVHKLYMDTVENIIELIESFGFKLEHKIDMEQIDLDSNYLCIFRKNRNVFVAQE